MKKNAADSTQLAKSGKTLKNPNASARRKLVKMIGGGSGVALGTTIASGWVKPVINSTIIPGHATTTETVSNDCSSGMTVGINVISFDAENFGPFTMNLIAGVTTGGTTMATLTGNNSGGGTVSLSGSAFVTDPLVNLVVRATRGGATDSAPFITWQYFGCTCTSTVLSETLTAGAIAIASSAVRVNNDGTCTIFD